MTTHDAKAGSAHAGLRPSRRAALAAGLGVSLGLGPARIGARGFTTVKLVPPGRDAPGSLQAALSARRSVRRYAAGPVALAELSALLWAAQGVSSPQGLRTAPSAGALYPLEIHVVATAVDGLTAGTYRYVPAEHALEPGSNDPVLPRLLRAAGGQEALAAAPVVLVIAAVPARSAARYGARADRYVAFEAGAASQNVALMAASRGLGSVVIGAFDDDGVAQALQLPAGVRPLALMPVGRPG